MKKRNYIIPQSEVTNLGALGRWMKDFGEASLPNHMGAPKRRTDVF
jgi:hypothetical protein